MYICKQNPTYLFLNLSVYGQYHECQNMYKVIKTIPAQAGKVMTPTQHH